MKSFFNIFAIFLPLLLSGLCSFSGKFVEQSNSLPVAADYNAQTSKNTNVSGLSDPIDDQSLLTTLVSIENDWKQAKISGDINVFDKIFADEFINTTEDGKIYSKTVWINYLSGGDLALKKFNITEVRLLSRQENTATISFKITSTYYDKKSYVSSTRDTDNFIWRDGRWQVTSSKSVDTKN